MKKYENINIENMWFLDGDLANRVWEAANSEFSKIDKFDSKICIEMIEQKKRVISSHGKSLFLKILFALSHSLDREAEMIRLMDHMRKIHSNKFAEQALNERHIYSKCITGGFASISLVETDQIINVNDLDDFDQIDFLSNLFILGTLTTELDLLNLKLDRKYNSDLHFSSDRFGISKYNLLAPRTNFIDATSNSFKDETFRKIVGCSFNELNDSLKLLSELCDPLFVGSIDELKNMYNNSAKITRYPVLNFNLLCKTILAPFKKQESIRPLQVSDNLVEKPLVTFGEKIVTSKYLLRYSKTNYYQQYLNGSPMFKVGKDLSLSKETKETYSHLLEKWMQEKIVKILEEQDVWKYRINVNHSEWGTDKSSDLGDIDFLLVNERDKIVFFFETKYKSPLFYNLTSRFKSEEKWVKRQEQRLDEFQKFIDRCYPGFEWNSYIVTNYAMQIFSKSSKIDNLVDGAVEVFLKEDYPSREKIFAWNDNENNQA